MKVLFVGGEGSPFSKTGGLGDVLGSLPKELVKLGIDARVVLPKHKMTKDKFHDKMVPLVNFRVTVGPKEEYAGIESIEHDGVTFYFVDNEYYFGYRDTLYGHYDDGERYGFFDNAVMKMLGELDYYPDIIHCNDWQAGLIPYILNQKYKKDKKYKDIKTMFTIHNIAYQGQYVRDLVKFLDIDYGQEMEFNGGINFLKTGINTADFVTTVSETYAKEILYDYFAYGMNTILETRKEELFGIVNGIDYTDFNPETDPQIYYNFSIRDFTEGKPENKRHLRKYYHLERNKLPLIGMVSRLTEAKGFDLIRLVIEDLIKDKKIQFVLLGSGDPEIERYYRDLREKYPEQVGIYIGYNDKMARKIYAGSDMFLMPSRFEPCGLAQMISLKYGTLPIVRKTGGLRDTIDPFNKYTLKGNGFGFENFDSDDLLHAINCGIEAYQNQKVWTMLVQRAMEEDFSWKQSALKYIDLYDKLKGE